MKVGPKYKICRRLDSRVFGKCQTTKFSISGSSRSAGTRRPRKSSDYGLQLIEKQKVRYSYGLKEHQLASYVDKIRTRHRSGAGAANPATRLYQVLESRLDNVVFRLGLVPSRPLARQIVSHGHIEVNGRRVNIPAYQVKIGDKISVRPSRRSSTLFTQSAERLKDYRVPPWLAYDQENFTGEVVAAPLAEATPSDLDFRAILEFYSRV